MGPLTFYWTLRGPQGNRNGVKLQYLIVKQECLWALDQFLHTTTTVSLYVQPTSIEMRHRSISGIKISVRGPIYSKPPPCHTLTTSQTNSISEIPYRRPFSIRYSA